MSKQYSTETPTGTWGDWAEDRALRGIIRTALALPYERRVAIMGWLVRKVIAPRVGYRKRALEHLSYIWPDMPDDRKAEIADGVCDNFGRVFIENYSVKDLLARADRTALSGAGLAAIEAARQEGRPVLFVTGHFGNFEAPRAALVRQGYQIGGLYRPIANPYFNQHYAQNMHDLSGPVFEQGRRGTMGLVKHLKQGGMAVLLFDIYDSGGVAIDFMGKPAPTLTSAAEIARKTGALLVPFFGVRSADGLSFTAEFDAPLENDDPIEQTRAMTRALEDRITRHPEQWFWIHKRWKPKRQRKRAAATTAP
ncbi:lysophospholipid acyltransferase family protein [Donghicola sp. XS_ASV15]|uniref:lysophospholipid acyltransferase family protein n=1 Tax=Donghicola sp. XS_ASV15 TaxID=3241295 RepID=UPI0035185387